MMKKISAFSFCCSVFLGLLLASTSSAKAEEPFKLIMPVDCQIGEDCFLQNYADIDTSNGVRDPYCGQAAYDGHKGTDIRIRTMKDIDRNVSVFAAAAGTILATRDGVDDQLFDQDRDHAAVNGKECGNGVVIRHQDGYETQYCHLKKNSITVQQGDIVKAGDILGHVGSSGFSEFPHLHLSLRKNGQWIDPITGAPPGGQCGLANAEASFFQNDLFDALPSDPTAILSVGLTEQVPMHEGFVRGDILAPISQSSAAIVGWAWAINLRKDDILRIIVDGPDGRIATYMQEPLDRYQANYSSYAGKRLKPQLGQYKMKAEIIRNGRIVQSKDYSATIN